MEKETSDTHADQPEQPKKRGNPEALKRAREAKAAAKAAAAELRRTETEMSARHTMADGQEVTEEESAPPEPLVFHNAGHVHSPDEQPGFLLETYDDELASHGPWMRAEPARFVGSAVQMLFRHARTGNHIVVSVDPGEPHGRHPVIVLREMLDEFTAAHGV